MPGLLLFLGLLSVVRVLLLLQVSDLSLFLLQLSPERVYYSAVRRGHSAKGDILHGWLYSLRVDGNGLGNPTLTVTFYC